MVLNKWWERSNGTIAAFDCDNNDIGDVREVYEYFPICDHCGKAILDTVFGECDINGNQTLSLCFECNEDSQKHCKTTKGIIAKKINKPVLVKQTCRGIIAAEKNGIPIVTIIR